MENNPQMVIAAISAVAGALISLAFSYIPKLKEFYAEKSKKEKQGIMLVVVLLSGAAVMVIGCANLIPGLVQLSCDVNGFSTVVWAILSVAGGNQLFYQSTKYLTEDSEDEQNG